MGGKSELHEKQVHTSLSSRPQQNVLTSVGINSLKIVVDSYVTSI